MPTYGYECLSCHNQIEVFQSIKDDPLTVCETCGGSLRKKVYPVGIAFKGSGFYVNDYGKSAPAAPAAGGADAKPEAKAEVKAEAPKTEAPKAEAKAEPAPAA